MGSRIELGKKEGSKGKGGRARQNWGTVVEGGYQARAAAAEAKDWRGVGLPCSSVCHGGREGRPSKVFNSVRGGV